MNDLSVWLDRHAEFDPGKPAVVFEGRAISYAELAERVRGCARMLKHALGVGRGDRVAYLGHNSPELLIVLFACARLGAIFAPLNWRLAPPEHLFMLRDAAVKVLVVDAAFRAQAEEFRAELGDCEFLACRFEPKGEDSGWRSMAGLTREAAGDDRNPHVGPDSPLLLMYTSGTTGYPKGAVLTQEALHYNALNSVHMHALSAADRVLTVLPMFHVGGLNIQTTPALYAGATVLLHARFEPGETLASVRAERPTLLVLVPATMAAVIADTDWARTDLACLRSLTTGSCHVPRGLIETFHARGVPVIQVYGSTETCPIAVYQRANDAFDTIGSTGRPALHAELRIVDEQGEEVAQGRSGELLVRGPNVMFEYWGNAEATRESLRDGWFHSGDIGYRDQRGCVWINDRKRDVVISGGENVYPAELELVLGELPQLAEATVIGRPDPRWGEVPVAVVVPAAGAAREPEAVLGAFEGRLARFKHPKEVLYVEGLPRNAMGKVLKHELRGQLGWSG